VFAMPRLFSPPGSIIQSARISKCLVSPLLVSLLRLAPESRPRPILTTPPLDCSYFLCLPLFSSLPSLSHNLHPLAGLASGHHSGCSSRRKQATSNKSQIPNPKPQTLDPKSQTPNPKPRIPKPQSPSRRAVLHRAMPALPSTNKN
jgi:hypothetical protein